MKQGYALGGTGLLISRDAINPPMGAWLQPSRLQTPTK